MVFLPALICAFLSLLSITASTYSDRYSLLESLFLTLLLAIPFTSLFFPSILPSFSPSFLCSNLPSLTHSLLPFLPRGLSTLPGGSVLACGFPYVPLLPFFPSYFPFSLPPFTRVPLSLLLFLYTPPFFPVHSAPPCDLPPSLASVSSPALARGVPIFSHSWPLLNFPLPPWPTTAASPALLSSLSLELLSVFQFVFFRGFPVRRFQLVFQLISSYFSR